MTAVDLRFRLAEPADAAALGEFMARNFLAAYGHCSTPENVQAAVQEHYGEPAQLRQILDSHRYNLIALDGEQWVGHAQLHVGAEAPSKTLSVPALELSRFYVDTAFHGRGVAQAMMAEIKREARSRGAASLWLSAWQEAPQAIRFYEKSGFRIAGELIFMVGDDPKNDWLMACELA
jgi:GNAT superfamily N-acetyltransferase